MQYSFIVSGTVPTGYTSNIVFKSVTTTHLHGVKYLCYMNLSLSTRWNHTGGGAEV